MKLKQNQSGFGAVEVALIIVIIGILGFTGWFVWNSQKKTDKTLSDTTKSQTATVPKKTTSGDEKKQAETTKYLVVKEWGVQIPLSDAVADAYYQKPSDASWTASYEYYGVSTHKLASEHKGCEASQMAGGTIKRQTIAEHDANAQSQPDVDKPVNRYKLGNYYYDYEPSHAACGDLADGGVAQGSIFEAFNSAIKNIQQSNEQ